MSLEIFECDQNTPEWLEARRGILTASVFSDAMASVRDPAKSIGMRKKLLYKLAGERVTGRIVEGYRNAAMDRGHEQEAEARAAYRMIVNPKGFRQIGFARKSVAVGHIGCSPDTLIDDDSGLEIKTLEDHLMVEAIMEGPRSHMMTHQAQVQGNMFVLGRRSWHLMLYNPAFSPIIVDIPRDVEYCAKLAAETLRFNEDLERVIAKVSQ